MTGLVKAKKYDWNDSNLALFGSDTEKQVKRESAESEPAWHGAGSNVGMQIWRVVKFKVEPWHKDDYGKFYEGDSYIVLRTYKKPDEDDFEYDLFFWIGKYSTQDEYGTAAYKTVELDTLLNDKPIQHREVMNHESALFKSLFPELTLLKGGASTGFRHVKPEEFSPRLMKISGDRKKIEITEISLKASNVNSDDIFLLDRGTDAILFVGSKCSKDEMYKSSQYMQTLKSDRNGRLKIERLNENEGGGQMHRFLEEVEKCKQDEDEDSDDDDNDANEDDTDGVTSPVLFRLSNESGNLEFNEVQTGNISRGSFISDDAFVLDTTKELFVWIGNGTSPEEKQNALGYAHNYLMKTSHPFLPVTVLNEGRETADFEAATAA